MSSFATWIERYSGADNEMQIFYHGTNSKNTNPNTYSPVLARILSEGLIPNPKKRSWSNDPGTFHSPSRDSIGGIYVTTNLITATSACRNKKDGELLIVMQLNPRILLADEDHVGFVENPNPLWNLNDYMIRQLWMAIKTNTNQEFIDDYREKYVNLCLEFVRSKLKNIHPGLENRLRNLFYRGFPVAVERLASHVSETAWQDDYTYRALSQKFPSLLLRPTTNIAEENFKNYQDAVTRALKDLTRSSRENENGGNFTGFNGRCMQPIGFKGKNRIICILEIFDKHFDAFKNDQEPGYSRVYIRYGEPPAKLVSDWTERVGDWHPRI